jgi:three-Cys-motif partner protein
LVKFEDNQPEKWYIKEHTRVKHEILKLYLRPWAKILGRQNKRLIILDGFAGRGEYFENGHTVVCGSPIIFMDQYQSSYRGTYLSMYRKKCQKL